MNGTEIDFAQASKDMGEMVIALREKGYAVISTYVGYARNIPDVRIGAYHLEVVPFDSGRVDLTPPERLSGLATMIYDAMNAERP